MDAYCVFVLKRRSFLFVIDRKALVFFGAFIFIGKTCKWRHDA